MSPPDFETHETGTHKRLNLLEHYKQRLDELIDAANRVIDSWHNGNVDDDLDKNIADLYVAIVERRIEAAREQGDSDANP